MLYSRAEALKTKRFPSGCVSMARVDFHEGILSFNLYNFLHADAAKEAQRAN